MAAKKKSAKKKVAKKAVKKVAKKTAKKVSKSPAKKAAKKVAKISTKKATKKLAKKATKKAAKKTVKKAAKKAAKKTVKKAAKKVTKKAAKKAPAKKSSPKPAKATPTKSKAKKAAPKAKAAPKKKPAAKPKAKSTSSDEGVSLMSIPKKTNPAPVKKAALPKKKKAVFKMTPFIQKQHQRLLDLRDQFISAIQGISKDTIRSYDSAENSATGMHQGDAGSDAYDRDYALSILAKEQDALYEIERAIHRIETGSYGICQMSGQQIPQIRLEVLPFARLTVECQSLWESKFGKKRYTIREGAEFTELL